MPELDLVTTGLDGSWRIISLDYLAIHFLVYMFPQDENTYIYIYIYVTSVPFDNSHGCLYLIRSV